MTDQLPHTNITPLRVLATSAWFEPGFRGGGPIRSIASIVDSVLADLRPKLMEEISRKMAEKK